MKLPALDTRLRHSMEAGNLTVSDLSLWLSRPRATVLTWVRGYRTPASTTCEEVLRRVALLEELVHVRGAGLVPYELTLSARKQFLIGMYHALHAAVSIYPKDITEARVAVWVRAAREKAFLGQKRQGIFRRDT